MLLSIEAFGDLQQFSKIREHSQAVADAAYQELILRHKKRSDETDG